MAIVAIFFAFQAIDLSARNSHVSFDPVFQDCSTIPAYISDVARDGKFREKVITALTEISSLGLANFKYAGYTEEIPKTPFYPRYPQTNYVVIALIDRWQSNIFPNNDALAAATSFRTRYEHSKFHVGVIVIDRAALAALSSRDSAVRSQFTVIRHELGHIAGFGHDLATSVMNAHALNFVSPFGKLPWPPIPRSWRDRCCLLATRHGCIVAN